MASKCGASCEVYSRVTGYFRPVTAWNAAKREEFKDRALFQVRDDMRIHGILNKEK